MESKEIQPTQPKQGIRNPVIPERLTQQQALGCLIDAARLAITKKVFVPADEELVEKAIATFVQSLAVPGPMPSS